MLIKTSQVSGITNSTPYIYSIRLTHINPDANSYKEYIIRIYKSNDTPPYAYTAVAYHGRIGNRLRSTQLAYGVGAAGLSRCSIFVREKIREKTAPPHRVGGYITDQYFRDVDDSEARGAAPGVLQSTDPNLDVVGINNLTWQTNSVAPEDVPEVRRGRPRGSRNTLPPRIDRPAPIAPSNARSPVAPRTINQIRREDGARMQADRDRVERERLAEWSRLHRNTPETSETTETPPSEQRDIYEETITTDPDAAIRYLNIPDVKQSEAFKNFAKSLLNTKYRYELIKLPNDRLLSLDLSEEEQNIIIKLRNGEFVPFGHSENADNDVAAMEPDMQDNSQNSIENDFNDDDFDIFSINKNNWFKTAMEDANDKISGYFKIVLDGNVYDVSWSGIGDDVEIGKTNIPEEVFSKNEGMIIYKAQKESLSAYSESMAAQKESLELDE